MLLKAVEKLNAGDLVCIKGDEKNGQQLARWGLGEEAIGVTARQISRGESIEYTPKQSTKDILVKGSRSPMSGQNIVLKVSCDLKAGELVCIRQAAGEPLIDCWGFGDEAVGLAARNIKAGERVNFCAGTSTVDIQVKPKT